jgi:hypothetical protein
VPGGFGQPVISSLIALLSLAKVSPDYVSPFLNGYTSFDSFPQLKELSRDSSFIVFQPYMLSFY